MGLLNKDIFICVDCETTGLDVNEDVIIEVAAKRFTFGEVVDSYETLVDPRRPIPEKSIEIHHITQDMVAGKPTIDQVLPDLLAFIDEHVIIGHGVRFDVDMIARAAGRMNLPCYIGNNPLIDTLRLARLYGESPTNSLEQLRQHFNIASEGAHRAMSDVTVNIEVFKQLVKNFNTTEEVHKRLTRPILLKNMPLGKHKGRSFRDIPLQYLRWAANKDFDQDLLYSIRSELKRRKLGDSFSHSTNPFQNL